METPLVKNRFSPSQSCPSPESKGKAQQQFKKDCDLNEIMRKFKKGQIPSHYTTTQTEYGFVPALTLQEALNTSIQAQNQFMELPSGVRKRFDNDPVSLARFMEDPANLDEARELGLVNSPLEPVTAPEPPGAANTDEGAPSSQEASAAPAVAPSA